MREAQKNGVKAITIGVTVKGIVRVSMRDTVLIDVSIDELAEPWSEYLKNVFQAAVTA
jgi:hypothetical protein